jgi:hypothetical protein
MQVYKVIEHEAKFYILQLVYDPKVYSGQQWFYKYVSHSGFPVKPIEKALSFASQKDADTWIEDMFPSELNASTVGVPKLAKNRKENVEGESEVE